ncbi:MAG: hypothetical protein HZA78_00525 [Candidatus Schekmanbacteria bacterium]|nr:hypothetical protein [Candidatus Schekmanbacteria bacterium]
MSDSVWIKKGGTLSDKSACKEFGLTQEEIINAIKDGKLQYRKNYFHGNPYFRLLRNEVEAFVNEKCGKNYLENKKVEKELAQVNKELRKLKTELAALEQRKIELLHNIGG